MNSHSAGCLAVALLLILFHGAVAPPTTGARSDDSHERRGPTRNALLESKFVARQVFTTPCRWVRVEVRRQTPDPRFVGQALAPCRVVIRRGDYTFLRICALIVHEYGHLAGLGHSSDPNDIMHPARPPRYPACVRHAAALHRKTSRARRRARARSAGARTGQLPQTGEVVAPSTLR